MIASYRVYVPEQKNSRGDCIVVLKRCDAIEVLASLREKNIRPAYLVRIIPK